MAAYSRNYRKVRRGEDISVSFGRIVVALFMISISIFACLFVINKVNEISLTDGVVVEITETAYDSNVAGTRNGMFVTNGANTKYLKESGKYAKDEWIDSDGKAYYIGKDEIVYDGEYKENGQIYTLDKGALVNIRQDKYYVPQVILKDKPSNVRTTSYDAFLDERDNTYDNYYPIMIQRRTGSDEKLYLGGDEDKQYSSKYMLTGQGNYLYYLALGRSEKFAGKLYRVHLGQTKRESFGTKVDGYKVIGNAVYYCEAGTMLRAENGTSEYIGQYLNKSVYSKEASMQSSSNETSTQDLSRESAAPFPFSNSNQSSVAPGSGLPNTRTTNETTRVPFNFNPYGTFNPNEQGPGSSR